MDNQEKPIYPVESWKKNPEISAKMLEVPQPAVVIVGGMMYIFNNAQVEMESFVGGGSLQYMTFKVQGLRDANNGVGKEIPIGVEKMGEMINEYADYQGEQ